MGDTTRIALCVTYGGFSLSRAAFLRLRELGCAVALAEPDVGEPWDKSRPDALRRDDQGGFCREIDRDDPLLLRVLDEMGQAAAGTCCKLGVARVPAGVDWELDEHDGHERVAQVHQTWEGEVLP